MNRFILFIPFRPLILLRKLRPFTLIRCFIVVWAFFSQAAFAEAPHLVVDIKGAVKQALSNNPLILQAREKLHQNDAEKSLLKSALYPNLNVLGTGLYRQDNVTATGNAPFGGTPYNSNNLDLKLIQPLFAYGTFNAIKQSDYDRQISLIDLEIAERDLANKVIQTFYSVILNQKLLEVLNRQLDVLTETLKTSQNRYQTGRGQLLDLLQAKTQIALVKPKIADAQNRFVSAGAQLADYLGESQNLTVTVKGELSSKPLKEIDAKINLKDSRLPELERVRLSREQLSEQKEVALGKHYPLLNLVGDLGTNSYSKSDFISNSNSSQFWSVGLQLTIPLFSGFSSVYDQRRLSSIDYQLEFQSHNLSNDLQFKQIQARKTLESAEASLVSAEEASKLANDSIKEARRNFRLATIDFMVYLTVQNSSLAADSSLYQIKYDNISALANYFVASGQPIANLVDLLAEK